MICEHAAAVMSLAACLCAVSAFGAGSAYPRSADEAIAGALANVKSCYRAKLDHYGLTESYFDETSGICYLKCDNTAFCTQQKWG